MRSRISFFPLAPVLGGEGQDERPSPWLHRVAWLTALATFPLIFMGGLVTSHAAGLSVPDWPNSYGYNMFLFPISLWRGGIFYEHTHRLMGTVVGFCAIMLTSLAWAPGRSPKGRRALMWTVIAIELLNALGTAAMVAWPSAFRLPAKMHNAAAIVPQGAVTAAGILLVASVAWLSRIPEPRRWVRWLTVMTLIAVCTQGLLGGLRVDLINLTLAIIHGCFAQAFFCLTVFVVMVTSPRWNDQRKMPVAQEVASWHGHPARGLVLLASLMFCAVYLQLIVGAIMRHEGAGLAVPDVPLNYGHLLPPMNSTELAAANAQRAFQYHLDPVSLTQIWLHISHRIGATIVSLIGLLLIVTVWRRGAPSLYRPAVALGGLLIAQVTLGTLTVLYRKPADLASAHVAVGALVLITSFVLMIRSLRLQPRPHAARDISDTDATMPLDATSLA